MKMHQAAHKENRGLIRPKFIPSPRPSRKPATPQSPNPVTEASATAGCVNQAGIIQQGNLTARESIEKAVSDASGWMRSAYVGRATGAGKWVRVGDARVRPRSLKLPTRDAGSYGTVGGVKCRNWMKGMVGLSIRCVIASRSRVDPRAPGRKEDGVGGGNKKRDSIAFMCWPAKVAGWNNDNPAGRHNTAIIIPQGHE